MPGRTSQESPTETEEDFTGHVKDEATGLHYAGARYYSAAFGRWMSPDPKADKYPSLSPYNYVANNPLIAVDPDGKDFKIKVKRNDDDEIVGVTVQATVFVNENNKKALSIANKAASKWNNQSGSVNAKGFMGRVLSSLGLTEKNNVSVGFNISVKGVSRPAKAAKDTKGGNHFKLSKNEKFFNKQYAGKSNPKKTGGVAMTAKGKVAESILMPPKRNGKNANVVNRAAHEIGHLMGLDDTRSDGPLMDYYPKWGMLPGPSGQEANEVGKEWRGEIRDIGQAGNVIVIE